MATHRSIRQTTVSVAATIALGLIAVPFRAALAAEEKAPSASGRVHYRVSNPMMNGTAVVSWIDYGRKFRQDTKMSMGSAGQAVKIDTWSIGDGAYIYTYQPMMGKQIMRMKMPKGGGGNGPGGGSPFMGGGAGKVIGKSTLLGRPCEVRLIGQGKSGRQAKVWVWKGLPLRTEMSGPQGGGISMEATQVETAPKLAPALFKLPAGYPVKDFQMPAGRPGMPSPGPR